MRRKRKKNEGERGNVVYVKRGRNQLKTDRMKRGRETKDEMREGN